MKITLASASPRRIELIKKIPFLEVSVHPSDIPEHTDKTDPSEAVTDLAEQKARAVSAAGVDGLILAADTMVVAGGERMGKPHTREEAFAMFCKLCGRTHSVLTGVCLMRGDKIVSFCEKTLVEFGPYDDALVSAYIATGKPFDKAGGYGIQDEELAPLVVGISGDRDNIIGLPVGRVERTILENFYL